MARAMVIIGILGVLSSTLWAAVPTVKSIQPSTWWVGLNNPKLTLLISGKNLSNNQVHTSSGDVRVLTTRAADHDNYLFVDLEILPSAKPGSVKLIFTNNKKETTSASLQLLAKPTHHAAPIDNSDIIYQIFPDRIYNANPKNDNPSEILERADPLNPSGIHGGDFAGLIRLTDYFDTLGITTIELTSILATNQFVNSYERMGVTNFYAPDNRLGSMDELKKWIQKLHERQIKTILTFPLNQMGKQNPLALSPPVKQWLMPDQYAYIEPKPQPVHFDPYATAEDSLSAFATWPELDIIALNTNHPDLKSYLTQCCLWWMITTDADALKIDNSFTIAADLTQSLHATLSSEIPGFTLILDTPSPSPLIQTHEINRLTLARSARLSDYPLQHTLAHCFSNHTPPLEGLMRLYETMSWDLGYHRPVHNIVFADNHKTNRAYTNADLHLNEFLMMTDLVFTTRGIPMLLYGSEYLTDGNLMKGKADGRKDFPAFTALDSLSHSIGHGLTPEQWHAWRHIKKTIDIRRQCPALQTGKFIHFIPQNDLYVYFRTHPKQTIMVVVNNHPTEKKRLAPTLYSSQLSTIEAATDLMTGQKYVPLDNIIIAPKSVMILELNATQI
ncbi:cyclomaltodextrinase N-terminal domain-containing protein [Breznakibacter xylanolyticus]|nr:cyclomaltodextrinase N-terminal domain-containing protein [Breznakibacter xylanolyticus]